MTPSEEYVASLCEKSFLPFWSFPNPLGKKDKELCDVLVVCGNTIILISVKDIQVSNHKDKNVQYTRWVKKAVDDSIQQLYGAERFLKNVNEIKLKNGVTKVTLPDIKVRTIYRIAIAFGSDYDFPLPMGINNRGFVHVFDEKSTATIISELDTITDFTRYLKAKENFLISNHMLLPEETDFFALYIQTGLEFDYPVDSIAGSGGLWESYIKSEDYRDWRKRIVPSFIWDYMIAHLHTYHIKDGTNNQRIQDLESAIRIINQEDRIHRTELGLALDNAIKRKSKGRMLLPKKDAKHMYVFMPLTMKNWDGKEKELELRCIVARYLNPSVNTVIGIGIGTNGKGDSVYDICYHYIPETSDDFIKQAREIQQELGYFENPKYSSNSDYSIEDFKGFGIKY
ncbi:nuclease-related domain-containing protein [Tenacibaculum holothuriorum]|nr:nuclease-related domain-containing protein [Tenacibaculum holothuriorum]